VWQPLASAIFIFRLSLNFLGIIGARKGWVLHYWIHCDRQAQVGDLRRVQILTSDELSLRDDLRGPYNSFQEAIKIAESLIWSIVTSIMDRLRTEQPQKFATFPSGNPTTEE
jgi:hypothetical protein